MKKIIFLVLIIVSFSAFNSCKVCKSCQCWKNGQAVEMDNCSYGFPPNKRTLDTWEKYLIEELKYDSVKCVME
ncbi:MAG: hypothetical protein LBH32_12855 [Dysgonamonadaceae bacterium]|jgi:hypothetical protein|nr:hypothetical protein [Dysgonamonadaceae bacterium]